MQNVSLDMHVKRISEEGLVNVLFPAYLSAPWTYLSVPGL